MIGFEPLSRRHQLHSRVTEILARRVIEAARAAEPLVFPKESDLCQQLGVSRTVLRESMKVLADKGMVGMKPRLGTRAKPRSEWRLLDPDILAWQAEIYADAAFLRDLCEVRLAIEPTAAGFAAVRASAREVDGIEELLREREAKSGSANHDEIIDLDLRFHTAVVAASHNPLLLELSSIIRQPYRIALSVTLRFPAIIELGREAHQGVVIALRNRDPMAARRAADEAVGLAMLAVEKAIRSESRNVS